MKENNKKLSSMQRTVIGGAAVPKAMLETFEKDYNVNVIHAWGMTEMSPLGTACNLKKKHGSLSSDEKMELSLKQGRAIYGVDMKIVDGALAKNCRGTARPLVTLWCVVPWITSGYFKSEGGSVCRWMMTGFFDTGDVATIDADGYMQITDRSKDVIKSGGEWISSIDVENKAVGCPGIAEAAVIAVSHPKWDERPPSDCRQRDGCSRYQRGCHRTLKGSSCQVAASRRCHFYRPITSYGNR